MDRSLVHLPPTVLEARRLAPALSAFPNLRGAAFPNPAYPREQVLVKPLIDGSLEDYEVCFAGPDGRWQSWRLATRPFHTSFPRPGEAGCVCFRLRYKGMESAIQAVRVDVLPYYHFSYSSLATGGATVLEGGKAFAIAAADGNFYVNPGAGESYYFRSRDFQQCGRVLVSPTGRCLTEAPGLGSGADGSYTMQSRMLVHDIHSSRLLGSYDLAAWEKPTAILEAGYLQTEIAAPGADYNRPAQACRTRLRDIDSGTIISKVRGRIVGASASGTIALETYTDPERGRLICFLANAGQGDILGECWDVYRPRWPVPISPDGACAFTGSQIMRLRDGHCTPYLSSSFLRFADGNRVWLREQRGPYGLQTVYRLYNVTTEQMEYTIPHRIDMGGLAFAPGAVMPDYVVGGSRFESGRHCDYQTRDDDYSTVHVVQMTTGFDVPYSHSAVTPSNRIWGWHPTENRQSNNTSSLWTLDLGTGAETRNSQAVTWHSNGAARMMPDVRNRDHLVTLSDGFPPCRKSGVDDSTGAEWTWILPDEVDAAYMESTDGDKTGLWWCYKKQNAEQMTRGEKREERFYLWNYQSGVTVPVAAPEKWRSWKSHGVRQFCFAPDHRLWLVLTTYVNFDNGNQPSFTRCSTDALIHSLSLSGQTERVLTHKWEHTNRPAIALSHAFPGLFAFFDIHQLGVVDAFSGDTIWHCPNPMDPGLGIPDAIHYGPGECIWASFRGWGTVAIDRQAQVDSTTVLSGYLGLPEGWSKLERYVRNRRLPAER